MKMFKSTIVGFLLSILMCAFAWSGQVTISLPADEELSSMALREKAMALGFAQAVTNEAQLMLPGQLDELRLELLTKYYVKRAKPYIQGYKIIASEMTEEGVFIGLDVTVNRKNLRQSLKSMGLFQTSINPVVASIFYPQDMDEEAMELFQGLMTLTGVQPGNEALPAFTLERGPEHTFRAKLVTEEKQWASIQKDMSVAWYNVWKRYFTYKVEGAPKVGAKKLSVAGWFSPDAVLEFDRVLRGWESAIQEVELMELDMQSSGVGGTWAVRLLSTERLNMLLKSYLPQRGLTYQLSEENDS